MTGLEKITAKINSDAEARCNEIIASAEKQCEAIAAEAEKKGAAIAAETEKSAKAEGESIITIAKSGAAQLSRQTLLSARVEAVNETLVKLADALKALPDDKYFATVIKLACSNAMSGKCTAYLSAADNARLPSGFESELVSSLSAKGAEVTLSKEPASVDSGIVLDYGDINIDCSFEAIIEENADSYKETISKIIF